MQMVHVHEKDGGDVKSKLLEVSGLKINYTLINY